MRVEKLTYNNAKRPAALMAGRFCSVPTMVVALLVACLLCVGCGGRRSGRSASVAEKSVNIGALQSVDVSDTATVDTIDFGRVKEGELLSRTFALHNGAQRPMVIASTSTSCGCLWLDYEKNHSVGAGESVAVEMNFDSAGYTYFVPRAFYITTTLSEKAKKIVVVATME
ncbi:MAG: DUF1573 domain-containing protein [Tidjanibacter sp.]|nr:DUF1573 domain-containing protein [Tidjanibacter sp.]MBR3682572.1 DUF1573 domain-containing protein [Tidjanibacter sp.]MBR3853531.1 DUF1573 domain-containing protein [Tidjanibacter sp.]MBR7129176.1 DUF1573 domain-containing protein [Tidjanibacter sp.]